MKLMERRSGDAGKEEVHDAEEDQKACVWRLQVRGMRRRVSYKVEELVAVVEELEENDWWWYNDVQKVRWKLDVVVAAAAEPSTHIQAV